ncbi:hypothetical protein ACFV0L_05585 [Streptosporangium canum]|uniref:hypothetical protein n=1 Tax=Streptosporangium canum TaxID=324952 RepID=UPI0036C16419
MDWTKRLLTRSDQAENYLQRITQLLQSADLGVTRLDTDPETGEIRLWHRTPDGGETPLDFRAEESLGTHAWFAFLGPMLTVLDQGSVLLVDEVACEGESTEPDYLDYLNDQEDRLAAAASGGVCQSVRNFVPLGRL